jgi:hypothetical protein
VGTRSTRPNLLTITTELAEGLRVGDHRAVAVVLPAGPGPDHKSPYPGPGIRGPPGPGSLGGLVKRYPCIDWPIRVGRTFTRCSRGDQNELVRVVVTRIEWDGTMQRRMVDTAQRSGGLCRVRTRSWA